MDGGKVSESTLREMGLVEFVSHLEKAFRPGHQRRVTFFLGAGASRSSKIPTAGELVKKRWLPLLRERARENSSLSLDEWALARYPGEYDPQNPTSLYGRLIDDAFPSSLDRQREIEHLVGLGRPGVGYGLLARFMGHPEYSRTVHTILTTNFDDMVADALQIHVRKRARVIGHHSLAAFIQDHHATPQIVKLHGDAHLEPLNTTEETSSLSDGLLGPVKRILAETMLVFIGYGGGDHSVVKLLKGLGHPPNAGVWWVNDKPPVLPEFHDWLAAKKGRWVKHLDFDELMVLLAERFPEMTFEIEDHFREDRENYQKSYQELTKRLNAAPSGEPGSSLKRIALEEVSRRLNTAWGLAMRADALKLDDPEEAERLYEQAVQAAPLDAGILGNYATFMKDVRKDFARAEELYERALAADPEDANALGNYALFVETVGKDFARAEELYERALAADPEYANALGNYAVFMKNVRKDFDRAEELYKRALAADPEYANTLRNFAIFMADVRKDFDRAEELYERALAADPEDANALGNYAVFMKNVRKDFDRAEELYKRALAADPEYAGILGNFANFMKTVRKDFDRAEALYQRALSADPEDADILGSYATFMADVRKDFDRAEELYERALSAESEHANNLGNFGGFLLGRGRTEEGFEKVRAARRALDVSKERALLLELEFYQFVHGEPAERPDALRAMRELIDDGVRSPDFDLSAHCTIARDHKHPDADMIAVLAEVIADHRPADDLLAFPSWGAAGS